VRWRRQQRVEVGQRRHLVVLRKAGEVPPSVPQTLRALANTDSPIATSSPRSSFNRRFRRCVHGPTNVPMAGAGARPQTPRTGEAFANAPAEHGIKRAAERFWIVPRSNS
jgi:hypothetical protein